MDEKRRLQIPSKWRPVEHRPEEEYLVRVYQPAGQKAPCLLVLSPEAFNDLDARMRALPFDDNEADAKRRKWSSGSDIVTIDAAGRICLSQRLVDAAGIGKRVMMVGMFDRFEIWSEENYKIVKADDNATPPAQL